MEVFQTHLVLLVKIVVHIIILVEEVVMVFINQVEQQELEVLVAAGQVELDHVQLVLLELLIQEAVEVAVEWEPRQQVLVDQE